MKTKYEKWTEKEIDQLEKEVHLGYLTARQIADRHGRTEKSINQKLYKMRKSEKEQETPKPETDPGLKEINQMLFAITVMLFTLTLRLMIALH